MARKNEQRSAPVTNGANGNALILPVEDGQGHGFYVVVAVPDFDPANENIRRAYEIGVKYEALRKAQSDFKSAARDGKDLTELAKTWTWTPEVKASRLGTVDQKRAEIGETRLKAALAKNGKPSDDAVVAALLPQYMASKADAIESDLQAFLAAGYTPSKRGSGGSKAETVDQSVIEGIDIGSLD